jgi:hypothetical protein
VNCGRTTIALGLASAPSRLKVGVAGFGACWETSDHKEVSHEQEVYCTSFG